MHLGKELRTGGFRGSEGRTLAKPKVRAGPFSKSRLQNPPRTGTELLSSGVWVGLRGLLKQQQQKKVITQPICSPPVSV